MERDRGSSEAERDLLPTTGSNSSRLNLLEFALELELLGTVLTLLLLALWSPAPRGGRRLLLLKNGLFREYCRKKGEDLPDLLLLVGDGRRLVR